MVGIGERLKLARAMRRLSQRGLAERAGVSAMAISKYENNEMMPGSDVLRQLAKALDVRMEFLLRPAPEVEIRPVFRKHSRLGKKATGAVIAQIREWLERYLTVESFFPDEEIGAFSFPKEFPYAIEAVKEAEQAAEELRKAWRLGEDPTENLTELLEDRGIKVGMLAGDGDFDACTFSFDGDNIVIAVKRGVPGDRQRFNLAHELGHIMLKVMPEVEEEKAAHRFAGAFLVSARAARMELGSARRYLDPHELMLLKKKYGMSMAAWVYRAKDLGILDAADAERLWRDFRTRGWHKQEPGRPLPAEEPTRLKRLVWRLAAEDVISRSRAAELLDEPLAVFANQEEGAVAVPG
ncbi:MAG: helix-turn-helix domain-containing protein [Candidatus Promineifilaceae bacterium]